MLISLGNTKYYIAKAKGESYMRNLEREVLFHYIWKYWDRYKKKIYSIFSVKNIGDLLNVTRNIDGTVFLERIFQVIGEPTRTEFDRVLEEVLTLKSKHVRIVTVFDSVYPQRMLKMKKITERVYPPLLLYSAGALDNFNQGLYVAVVGTRDCTREGKEMARKTGKFLASEGYILVTGLARGIDMAATLGALEAGGTVIGVRPWLDALFSPPKYIPGALSDSIQKRGAIVAENAFPKRDSAWIRAQFQKRNRIIAGMSDVVIVIEAKQPGGTMHQIEYALKRNRSVYIWKPESSRNDLMLGYKSFIKKGARPFQSMEELTGLRSSVAS